MIQAGKFNKCVDIQHCITEKNEYNEAIEEWKLKNTVWCSIDTPTGKEVNANKDIQLDKVIIKMWITEINNNNRIKYMNEIYDILAVIEMYDHLVIHARRNHDK